MIGGSPAWLDTSSTQGPPTVDFADANRAGGPGAEEEDRVKAQAALCTRPRALHSLRCDAIRMSMTQPSRARTLDLLFEIGTMRHIQRTWRQFGGLPFANVAEHSFRAAWIAAVLAKDEGADLARTVFLVLAHDFGETRTGDTNYVSRLFVQQDEALAHQSMSQDTNICDELREAWAELHARKTLESRIAKDADSLDCDLELVEQRASGASLSVALRPTRDAVARKLYTDSARKLHAEIWDTDPHRWHTQAPNRLTKGDWRK